MSHKSLQMGAEKLNKPLPKLNIDMGSNPSSRLNSPTRAESSPMNEDNHLTKPVIFQPRTLKRRNIRHLTIENQQPVSPAPSSPQTPIDALASSIESLQVSNKIRLEDLVQLGHIGSGNSGTVLKVLHVSTNRTMAKKVIAVDKGDDTTRTQILRELKIMANIRPNKHIVGFLGSFLANNELTIVMEYMDCGSLDTVIKRRLGMDEMVVSSIANGVLQGLHYLYSEYRIIHRDIKPSNVLLSSKGLVKICDFGVSRELINSIADTFVGTSTYMSPERISGGRYSTKGDVWSLGLMIIELASGESPLGRSETPEGILDLLQRIVNEAPPRLNSGSREIRDFVAMCCVKDERTRASPVSLLTHPFITRYMNDCDAFKTWCKQVRKLIK